MINATISGCWRYGRGEISVCLFRLLRHIERNALLQVERAVPLTDGRHATCIRNGITRRFCSHMQAECSNVVCARQHFIDGQVNMLITLSRARLRV